MLHQCPCGGIVRCNGLFGSVLKGSMATMNLGRREEVEPSPSAGMAGADCGPVFGMRNAGTSIFYECPITTVCLGTLGMVVSPTLFGHGARDCVRLSLLAERTTVAVDVIVKYFAVVVTLTEEVIG